MDREDLGLKTDSTLLGPARRCQVYVSIGRIMWRVDRVHGILIYLSRSLISGILAGLFDGRRFAVPSVFWGWAFERRIRELWTQPLATEEPTSWVASTRGLAR